MAPSRGLTLLYHSCLNPTNVLPRYHSTFTQVATNPTHKTQIYLSRTLDPYLNLSIEHFLLQKSPPDSTVLFLYTNRPCIVIGRNQNPWVEVNLGLVNDSKRSGLSMPHIETISLVRRRSGGGTVFHDEGNVNYSVICPTAAFNRDQHAQMVVRGLRRLGVTRAKVNERHDIVLENSEQNQKSTTESRSISTALPRDDHKPLKVSGSAYRLTRLRSLHHGTCLLSSPNISHISQYLRSPAKPYIKARGVDSVASPITNVNVSNEAFENALIAEFGKMYGAVKPTIVANEASEVTEIASGLAEMKSLEWIYMQTPQFTFSSHDTNDDARKRPLLPDYFPPGVTLSFTARNGTIIAAKSTVGEQSQSLVGERSVLDTSGMVQKRLHTIGDWQEVIPEPLIDDKYSVSRWLNALFGNDLRRKSTQM